MNNKIQNQYTPELVTPPGETLIEILSSKLISQAELSKRMGRPLKTINEIIKGKTAIIPETALQLERVLGVPANFWITREQHYREYLARTKEMKFLQTKLEWLNQFPLKKMIEYQWIKNVKSGPSLLQELLSYFGVASIEAWEGMWSAKQISYSFRKSSNVVCNVASLRSWLRQGEIRAQQTNCNSFDESLFKKNLNEIKSLKLNDPNDFITQIQTRCSNAGVIVDVVRELPNCPVSGATRWLSKNKALIQLSLRYKTDDHLWFTLFHEAGHILMHGKRDIFVDISNSKNQIEREKEADEFAADCFIPRPKWMDFVKRNIFMESDVNAFARTLNIAPSIIVGRLQHERRIPFNSLNDIKIHLTWA